MRPVAALAGVGLLAGCAALPPSAPVAGARLVVDTLVLEGRSLERWRFVPETPRSGLFTLQHGFLRHCANLRETGLRLAAGSGLEGWCLNADLAGGAPALAAPLAAALPPGPVVAGGHSAGALFAALLAAELARGTPGRLAGVLLLDPVDAGGRLAPALDALAGTPVLAVVAPPSRCNAQGNARPALVRARAGAGAQVVEGGAAATHADAEGGDTDRVAAAACGVPQPGPVASLRDTAAGWLRERLSPASRPSP